MDNKKTDQWLRSSMKDYKPVPGGNRRAIFLQEALPLVASQSGNNRKWLLLGFLLLLAGALAIYLVIPEKKQLSAPALLSTTPTFTTIPSNVDPVDSLARFTDELDVNHSRNKEVVQSLGTSEKKLMVERNSVSANKSVTSEALIVSNRIEEAAVKEPNTKTVLENAVPPKSDKLVIIDQEEVSPKTHDELIVRDRVLAEVRLLADEKGEVQQESSKGFGSSNHLAYMLFYRPEITYNLIEDNKVSHSIGFDVQYRFFNNRYSIRTGLGLSITKGYYEYATDYQAYLGAFEKLDSITFAWDERQYHLNPTYYMSEKEVFDDTLTTAYSQINKKHLYLQIPMMLGYDFISNKSWRLGLRAGPRLSLLVQTKTLNHMENWGKNKVIQINQITPERIQANWQFVGAANLGMMTKGRLFFELEPQFTYYFNSVYEKADYGKSPWSLSLRLAIGIK